MEYEEVPDPRAAADDLVVKAEAIGVNFVDTMRRSGLHPTAPRPPFTPGIDDSDWYRMSLPDLQGMGITHILDGTGRFLTARQTQHDAASFQQVFAHQDVWVYAVHY